MAWDFVKRKSSGRDYARGEPPPAHSHEWAGIPQSAADMMARGRGKTVKGVVGAEPAQREEKSKGPILWIVGGFIVGLITGSWGRED